MKITVPLLSSLQSIRRYLLYFRELLVNGGYALGNILLLMGGDDSVDISFKPYSGPLLNSAALPLAADNKEGHNA